MKNSLNVITIFGFELPWNLDTALFWLLVAQVALIMFMVIVFAVLIRRVGRRNDNATFVIQQPEEMRTPVEVPAPAVIEEPRVEFPEELQGIWGIEGHDDIRVVIGANTLSVDGVVATGITETETEGEYAFLLGDVEYTVFLKRARKHEETPAEEVAPAEAAATETPETPAAAEAAVAAETPEVIGEAEAADAEKAEEDDGNLRLINGGDYSYCKLYKWVKEAAPEVEAEPIVITFPDSLRGDWVVEGHESVHVRIEEHTLFIDGIEATDIALDADKPTEYMCKVNGLDYVVAYDTSDESGFRNISGGEFKACALVELVEAEAEPEEEEPVIITFPETLRGDWVVEGHEGVHVAIQEYTARIDGVEAKNIALDDEGNYLLTANELNYVIAYNTSDETPVRTIDGGNFERANLIEYVEPAEEPAEEPVEEAPVEEIAEAPVEEAPAAEPEPEVKPEEPATIVVDYGEEESHESGVLRYDKSFTARYIQSSDEIKDWYTKLKNEMLSYKKVKARMSWKRETFRYGRETVALLAYRGSTLCIFLPLNPADYEDSKYKVEDVSDSPSYADTPCMYRLKNEKRVRLAIELFATVMERLGAVRIERISEDYYLPYEGIVELIDKGLVKRVIKNRSDEAIFAQIAPAGEPAEEAPAAEPVQEPTPEPEPEPTPEPAPEPEPEPEPTPEPTPEPEPEAKHGKPALIVPDYGEEESHEGGVLRYDKSFTAKLIQSEDEVKGWYTDIKNELLSYKRVHARMSWKRESYNFGREAFAKMSFRGNTLCLYLPIDPSSLMDSKYKVESVEENASYAETPCLYRIKNLKRAKYAKELIAIVAGFVQTEKIERESVDYYLPYEGLVELINKGLIKRNIKDKSEEAFFDDRKPAEQELPAATEEPAVEETAEVTPEETAAVPEETPAEEPAVEVAATEEAPAEEPADEETADEVVTTEETPAEEPADEETADEVVTTEETPAEEPAVEETADEVVTTEETPAEEPAVEETADKVAATEEAPAEEPAEEPADEVAATEEAPAEEPAVEETADEVAAAEETPAEEPAVEETADEVAATEEVPAEEPAEEPAVEETEVEELSPQELEYVRSYEEETGDEDGIEVVGVMFRHRGRKVYWFDPDGKEWKKGEIALYITPDNPPQEVIVVDNAKLSPSKLHLPLKPLCKLNRRPQTDNK